MTYRLSIEGHTDSDDLRSLSSFLAQEPQLRGRLQLVDSLPPAGSLGAVTDVVMVAVGSGGALTALTGAAAVWLQSRGSAIKIRLQDSSGRSAEIDADKVKGVDAATLRDLLGDVERTLRDTDTPE